MIKTWRQARPRRKANYFFFCLVTVTATTYYACVTVLDVNTDGTRFAKSHYTSVWCTEILSPKRSLQQVYIGGLVWCQSCVALNCVWSHLEVADPQLPGIGQFHHGNKTAGKQPLNDAYLPSICSGSQDTQSLYHKVMWLSGGCYHDYQLYNRYVLNRVREQFHHSIHTEYEDGTDLAGGACPYLSRSLALAAQWSSEGRVCSHSWSPQRET